MLARLREQVIRALDEADAAKLRVIVARSDKERRLYEQIASAWLDVAELYQVAFRVSDHLEWRVKAWKDEPPLLRGAWPRVQGRVVPFRKTPQLERPHGEEKQGRRQEAARCEDEDGDRR